MGDQVVGAQEDVELAGLERVERRVEAHAVDDREQVRFVVVDLRLVDLEQAVLDGERMEGERVAQQLRLGVGRRVEVDPVQRVRPGLREVLRAKVVELLRPAALPAEVRERH